MVLAGTHGGNYNGISVTSDINILSNIRFDLIIVHGWTGGMQNIAFLSREHNLSTPLLYLLIKPEERPEILNAMNVSTYIGCATPNDVEFVAKHGFSDKIIMIEYPIEYVEITKTEEEIKKTFGITKSKIYISVGGFSPHKGMDELVEIFEQTHDMNSQLILTGYDTNHGFPSSNDSRISLFNLHEQKLVYELMTVADLLIWNSNIGSEGYGLVLLESMLYGCPWVARNDAGAAGLNKLEMGNVYVTSNELLRFINDDFVRDENRIESSKEYVKTVHDPIKVTYKMLTSIVII
jgi:glycosyltransferase involved in cell wall biosynthesis